MPTTITLAGVSYRTPDGAPLFDHVDLSFGPLRTGLVGRNGTGKTTLLRLILGEVMPTAGSISVAGRLGVLRQSVQIGAAATVAEALGVAPALERLARISAGDGKPEDFAEADWTLEARLATSLADAGLGPELDLQRPVATLSGGERTRLALAALMLEAPDMLLLDEPTNNLDAAGRAAVAEVLSRWRGGAIVVSHDRMLLRQMDAIVELTGLGTTSYGGNWDFYRERKALELAAAQRQFATAERQLADIDRRNQAQAERKAHRDSAGRRKAAGGGLPAIVAGGMKRHAEETAGAATNLANRLRQQAAANADAARERIEVLEPVTVTLAPTGLPAGRRVLQADGLSGGPDGRAVIRDFDLVIGGPERIAITGPNGAGKTTLLKLLTGALVPTAGSLQCFVRSALLDQTVSLLDPRQSIRDNYRRLNPADDENACRAALARFKFRADAALQSAGSLSGGEILRAGLAATIGATNPPQLLILDEPTNHLDIEAIAAVEAGLRAYDGALLVVSHDRDFLENIGVGREIVLGGPPAATTARR